MISHPVMLNDCCTEAQDLLEDYRQALAIADVAPTLENKEQLSLVRRKYWAHVEEHLCRPGNFEREKNAS